MDGIDFSLVFINHKAPNKNKNSLSFKAEKNITYYRCLLPKKMPFVVYFVVYHLYKLLTKPICTLYRDQHLPSTKFGLNMLKRCRDIALRSIWHTLLQICLRIIQEWLGLSKRS